MVTLTLARIISRVRTFKDRYILIFALKKFTLQRNRKYTRVPTNTFWHCQRITACEGSHYNQWQTSVENRMPHGYPMENILLIPCFNGGQNRGSSWLRKLAMTTDPVRTECSVGVPRSQSSQPCREQYIVGMPGRVWLILSRKCFLV